MEAVKKLSGAFITGGCIALLGQIIMMLLRNVLGADSPILIPCTLLSIAVLGTVLFIFNIYQKIENIGGFGAIMPFSGLTSATANIVISIRSSGAPLSQAILGGVKFILITFVPAAVVCALIAIVANFVMGG